MTILSQKSAKLLGILQSIKKGVSNCKNEGLRILSKKRVCSGSKLMSPNILKTVKETSKSG